MKAIYLNQGKDCLKYRDGSGNTVEIFDIVVGSDRRKGIGSQMVRILRSQLPPEKTLVYAITRASNQIAHRFYEACGFRLIANLFDFYKDDPDQKNSIDAIMYGLDLGRPKL